MARKARCLNYHQCTAKELRTFFEARTGEVTTTQMPKPHYIQALLEADQDLAFRFLDLPPELRNIIYTDVLTLRPRARHVGRKCWPEILSTSKQIHEEATGILYSECDLNLAFRIPKGVVGWREPRYSVDIKGHPPTGRRSFSKMRTLWPAYLSKMESLNMVVTVAYPITGREAPPSFLFDSANRWLYTLCSFLAQSDKLKKLKVDIRTLPASLPSKVSEKLLWPLAKLARANICEITGINPEAQQYLLEQMRQQSPAHTIEKFRVVLRQAHDFQGLVELEDREYSFEDIEECTLPLHDYLKGHGEINLKADQAVTECARKLEQRLQVHVQKVKSGAEMEALRLAAKRRGLTWLTEQFE